MGTEFFDGLGETITRTAKELGERAEQIYETQKIRNKISGEERIIDKVMADIGNLIYKRHVNGEAMDSELSVLCEEIHQHILKIKEYRGAAADIKGQKLCPSCEKPVDKDVSFCPYCGAECPDPEKPQDEEPKEAVEDEPKDGEEPDCGSGEPENSGEGEESLETEPEQSVEKDEE